jgi:hypothetical protein
MAEQEIPQEEEIETTNTVGDRLLNVDSIDEIIEFVNKNAERYTALVLDTEEMSMTEFVSPENMDDETVNDLYIAMNMLLDSEYGEKHKDKIIPRGEQMYEPLQYEFRSRAGFPDAYRHADAMNL